MDDLVTVEQVHASSSIFNTLTKRHLVTERRDGPDIAHENRHGCPEPVLVEIGLEQFRMITAARVDHGREHRHGMPMGRKALEMVTHPFVQQMRGISPVGDADS